MRHLWVSAPNRENRENREGGEKQLVRRCSLAPGTYVAGSAEASPNFACNSPQGVPGRGLKAAEYQRSGFNV